MLVPSFLLFFVLYVISFLLVLTCNDWFMLWMGLEINMVCYIMLIYKRYDLWNLESCYKYFFIQSISSACFLSLLFINMYNMNYLIMMMLMLKMGAGPFYFWFPSVMKGINWLSGFMLMSFQKFIPLMLSSMFINSIFWKIGMLSMFIGMFGSFNQLNIKELLAYSSIYHLGWLLICMMIDNSFWMVYLFMYSLLLLSIVIILIDEEIINMMMINKLKGKWWFFMSILSMGGMPPFLGFFLKVLTLYYILQVDVFYVVLLLMMSVVMFYVYFRLLYNLIMGYNTEMMWLNMNFYKIYYKKDIYTLIGMFLMLLISMMLLF